MIESYHSLDPGFCREILGRKLNSKLRKDLDEVSEKTGILVRSCRRQFDNIKKVFKAVEDVAPKNYVATISNTFGLSKTLAEKYAALVFAASFRLELTKKKLAYLSFDQVKQVSLMLVNDWGDEDEAQEPTLNKEFLASLKDIKSLESKHIQEHKNAVMTALKNRYVVIVSIELNYKKFKIASVSLDFLNHYVLYLSTVTLCLNIFNKFINPKNIYSFHTNETIFCPFFNAAFRLVNGII